MVHIRLEAGHKVIIADNLSNSKRETVENITQITGKEVTFYEIDVTDAQVVELIFKNYKVDAVIHFAGLKAVGESVEKPQEYYYNNLLSTMVLVNACLKHGVNKFVFSSSATVYGDNTNVPFKETMNLLPTTNPYGETKVMSERILTDVAKANPDFAQEKRKRRRTNRQLFKELQKHQFPGSYRTCCNFIQEWRV